MSPLWVSLEPSFTVFPGALVGSWIGNKELGLKPVLWHGMLVVWVKANWLGHGGLHLVILFRWHILWFFMPVSVNYIFCHILTILELCSGAWLSYLDIFFPFLLGFRLWDVEPQQPWFTRPLCFSNAFLRTHCARDYTVPLLSLRGLWVIFSPEWVPDIILSTAFRDFCLDCWKFQGPWDLNPLQPWELRLGCFQNPTGFHFS